MRLVGDIGGTKTLLASVPLDNENLDIIKSYKSYNYNNFELILEDYLSKVNLKNINEIGLAVAGPVANNCSNLTNLKWIIDAKKISEKFNVNHIAVYNDLEAIAAAVCNSNSSLEIMLLKAVNTKLVNTNGCRAVIAPGTGLGMSYLVNVNNKYIPLPSQGGHINFAPRTELQLELLEYMHKSISQVGLETVCSGVGIPNILKFFIEYKKMPVDKMVSEQLKQAEDWVPVIISSAIANKCEVCCKTIDLFVEILAIAVQTMMLSVYAVGGVYLAGGIAVALSDYLNKDKFLGSITNNYTMHKLLDNVPIKLCMNKNIALIGASELLNFDS